MEQGCGTCVAALRYRVANVLSFQVCGAHIRLTWLTISCFHAGLVCSLSPEQEGPEGVCVCLCACMQDCWQAET